VVVVDSEVGTTVVVVVVGSEAGTTGAVVVVVDSGFTDVVLTMGVDSSDSEDGCSTTGLLSTVVLVVESVDLGVDGGEVDRGDGDVETDSVATEGPSGELSLDKTVTDSEGVTTGVSLDVVLRSTGEMVVVVEVTTDGSVMVVFSAVESSDGADVVEVALVATGISFGTSGDSTSAGESLVLLVEDSLSSTEISLCGGISIAVSDSGSDLSSSTSTESEALDDCGVVVDKVEVVDIVGTAVVVVMGSTDVELVGTAVVVVREGRLEDSGLEVVEEFDTGVVVLTARTSSVATVDAVPFVPTGASVALADVLDSSNKNGLEMSEKEKQNKD